jgi:hypothetical protein
LYLCGHEVALPPMQNGLSSRTSGSIGPQGWSHRLRSKLTCQFDIGAETAALVRRGLSVAIALAVVFIPVFSAHAVDARVRQACKADYYQYCSQFSVGTDELRQCMRKVGEGLSAPCLVALVEAGEITKADVERHNAKKKGVTEAGSQNAKSSAEADAVSNKKSDKSTAAKKKDKKAAKSARDHKKGSTKKATKKGKAEKGSKSAKHKADKDAKTSKADKPSKDKKSKTSHKKRSKHAAAEKKADAKAKKSSGTSKAKTADAASKPAHKTGKKKKKSAEHRASKKEHRSTKSEAN